MKKVLLDCGANKGQSIEWFMKNRDDSGEYEVHCFEPIPRFEPHFEHKNLTFHSDAVSSRSRARHHPPEPTTKQTTSTKHERKINATSNIS